jgi:hypothetical protein
MHIIILMCYEQCKTLRTYNYAGLFQAATCFDVHVDAILTPHLVFKEQFCDADASMLSIMQTLQNPCQMQGYSTLLAVGTLQSLPEGKLHMLRSL